MKTLYWVLGGLAAAAGTGAVVYFVTRKKDETTSIGMTSTKSFSGGGGSPSGATYAVSPLISQAGDRVLSLAQVLHPQSTEPTPPPPSGAPLPQSKAILETPEGLDDYLGQVLGWLGDVQKIASQVKDIINVFNQLDTFLIKNLGFSLGTFQFSNGGLSLTGAGFL